MKKSRLLMVTALVLAVSLAGLVLTSCASGSYMDAPEASYDEAMPAYPEEPAYYEDDYITDEYWAEAGEDWPREPLPPDDTVGQVGDVKLRHIIRTGSIELSVKETRETVEVARGIVTEAGGLVGSSYVYEVKEGQFSANMTLRVPVDRFDAIMEQLEELGEATNVQTGTEDVTMEYVDLQSRLNNQKAQEKRLKEILDMADTVEDVLEVTREIYRVRGEIESMTAILNALQDRVAYSTINLTIRQETLPVEIVTTGAFEDFGRRVSDAFVGSINFIMTSASGIVIVLVALLPVLIILGALIALIWWIARSIKRAVTRKKKPVSDTAGVNAGTASPGGGTSSGSGDFSGGDSASGGETTPYEDNPPGDRDDSAG